MLLSSGLGIGLEVCGRDLEIAKSSINSLYISWRIDFMLAVLVYKCLHGLAPSYLADELHHPTELEFRRRLRSASSHELSVPCTTLNLRQPSFSSRCRYVTCSVVSN